MHTDIVSLGTGVIISTEQSVCNAHVSTVQTAQHMQGKVVNTAWTVPGSCTGTTASLVVRTASGAVLGTSTTCPYLAVDGDQAPGLQAGQC